VNFHGSKFSCFIFSIFVFLIHKIFRFDRRTKLNHLVVSNNVFILHLNEKTLHRRCLDETPKDSKTLAFQGLFSIYFTININKSFLFLNRSSNSGYN